MPPRPTSARRRYLSPRCSCRADSRWSLTSRRYRQAGPRAPLCGASACRPRSPRAGRSPAAGRSGARVRQAAPPAPGRSGTRSRRRVGGDRLPGAAATGTWLSRSWDRPLGRALQYGFEWAHAGLGGGLLDLEHVAVEPRLRAAGTELGQIVGEGPEPIPALFGDGELEGGEPIHRALEPAAIKDLIGGGLRAFRKKPEIDQDPIECHHLAASVDQRHLDRERLVLLGAFRRGEAVDQAVHLECRRG